MHKILKNYGARMTVMIKAEEVKKNEDKSYHRVVGIPADSTIEEWIEMAKCLHKLDPFDGITSFHEMDQENAAYVAKALGLPYHDPNVIQVTRNKNIMRQILREKGVDLTKNQLVTSKEEIVSFAQENGYPLIIKPVDGWGSIGVARIMTEQDLEKALIWFEKANFGSGMIVEQFLEGKEFSVEAFSENGKHVIMCITEKFKEEKHFVEVGHCVPYKPYDEKIELEIKELICHALDALNITHGPSHTEIMLTANGPRIIETHTRLGGDYIPELIKLVSGVDTLDLWAKQAYGESVLDQVPQISHMETSAAIWYVTPPVIGKLEEVQGVEEAKSEAGVVQIEILQQPGTELKGMKDSFSRTAYVIATGTDRDDALSNAQRSADKLLFQVV